MEMYWLRFIRNNISRYKRDGYRVDDIKDILNKSFCNNQNECKQQIETVCCFLFIFCSKNIFLTFIKKNVIKSLINLSK